MTAADRVNLLEWFKSNQRDLPWRENRDPYRVWISETMLQQTTSEAVKPFFRKFLTEFPTLQDLARAPIEKVIQQWAGLGYYSRARNLHSAAQKLALLTAFPKSWSELIEYPGFGPYTARAVSSISFNEPVGVIDGNVIRVLSRTFNLPLEWWKPAGRAQLQSLVNDFVAPGPSHILNQALMELGATVCLPQNPKCMICPVFKNCQARQAGTQSSLPLKKPKRASEIWEWHPNIEIQKGKVRLVKNDYAPFLKGQWFLPGVVKKSSLKPKKFSFQHSITHHQIFVHLDHRRPVAKKANTEAKWIPLANVSEIAPFSLIKKALEAYNDETTK